MPLYEKAIAGNAKTRRKARVVLSNGISVITQVKTEVEGVVGSGTHSTQSSSEGMLKTVPIQKGGMQRAHSVGCSTARLR